MTARLSAHDIADLLNRPRPTDEQAKIIEAPLTSMMVVAGAGSGKTETMSSRVVWLIANGLVEPQEVLGLTFTRKAAGELLDRVRARITQLNRALNRGSEHETYELLNQPTISTYNSYASSLVQEHGLRIGREPGARLLSEASQWAIVSEIVEKWQGDLDTESAISSIVSAVISLSGALNEHLLDIAEAKQRILELEIPLEDLPLAPRRKNLDSTVLALGKSLSTRRQLLDLVHEYNEYKRTSDSIDFGDQVALAARLAETVPVVGTLERSRFKVVLLDEYQDTSYAQIRFLSALYGNGHPVTAVGDPNQSIYAWRGASAAGPARFPEQFRTADGERATIFQLGTSWRNDTAILNVANTTSAPLYAADPVNSLPSLNPRPGAGTGQVDAAYYETIEDEAHAIAQYLKDNWTPGDSTAAVLCRKRSQFPLIESTLRAHNIPVEVVGLGGLLSTPEVVDVVAFLEAVNDPSRGDSLMRILTGPRVNLGAADLIALGAFAKELNRSERRTRVPGYDTFGEGTETPVDIDPFDERSILDAIVDLPDESSALEKGFTREGIERLRDIAKLLSSVRSLSYLSVPELVDAAEKILGLDVEVALAAERARREGARFDSSNPFGRAHLDALKRVAVNFTDTALTPTLGGFLAWLADAVERERGLERPVGKTDPNAVQLITVHASKGLEWDVVVVPGLTDGQFPSPAENGPKGPTDSAWLTDIGSLPYPLRGDSQDLPTLEYAQCVNDKEVADRLAEFKSVAGHQQVLDERRLAYVAFTRARSILFLTGAWWRTAKTPSGPSNFMMELVDAGVARLIEEADAPEPGAENPRDGVQLVAQWPYEAAEGVDVELADDEVIASHGASTGTVTFPALRDDLVAKQRDILRRTLHFTRQAAHRVAHAQSDSTVMTQPILSPTGLDLSEMARILLHEQQISSQSKSEVEFPEHISVSGIVEIDKDRDSYARNRRRPIPRQPSVASRRGTTFHLWVERHFGSSTLFDIDDLPGADDDLIESDKTLDNLMRTFERSRWSTLEPIALEQDVDIVIAGTVIRARIDAVFPDPDISGNTIVVDWKTGRAPTDPKETASRELQLALYRIAWSELTGTPLDKISAAFYYVASDSTVRPATLANREEIEQIMVNGR